MHATTLLLVLISVSISATAQLTLKLGMSRPAVTEAIAGGDWTRIALACMFSSEVIGGLALYGIGAMIWLFVLAKLDLSVAYPFVGLGFIMTMLLAVFLLGEQVTLLRLAGTLLIVVGCVLVARSA